MCLDPECPHFEYNAYSGKVHLLASACEAGWTLCGCCLAKCKLGVRECAHFQDPAGPFLDEVKDLRSPQSRISS